MFLGLIFSMQAYAETFKFDYNFKKGVIETVTFEKMVVSKNVQENSILFKQKIQFFYQLKKEKMSKHPADNFCLQGHGQVRILYDQKNNQIDFCLIDNKYYVDAWSLYERGRDS